jgi:hypothetical protein
MKLSEYKLLNKFSYRKENNYDELFDWQIIKDVLKSDRESYGFQRLLLAVSFGELQVEILNTLSKPLRIIYNAFKTISRKNNK